VGKALDSIVNMVANPNDAQKETRPSWAGAKNRKLTKMRDILCDGEVRKFDDLGCYSEFESRDKST
jgi:hypothetical protein